MSRKHLFIVCMNNSGSTLLHNYLSKCALMVPLPRLKKNIATSSEGHNHVGKSMPHPRDYNMLGVWTERPQIISEPNKYNWPAIRNSWNKAWKSSGKNIVDGSIFLEKSPPNVLRAHMLEKHFSDAHFIVMVRNPYAVSEGLRRRQGYSIERCAKHWGESTRAQIKNIKTLKKVVYVKYSDLCDNGELAVKSIKAMLPELEDLSLEGDFSGHHSVFGKKAMPIKNLNSTQIKNLGSNDIKRINKVLSSYRKELEFFGFKKIRRT